MEKKTIYFNLHYITTPIKKKQSSSSPIEHLKRFHSKFLMPSPFLVFVMSTINESSKWFKKSKLHKDSRLVTNTHSKHNCANHIHFIRLYDSKKGLAIDKRKFLLNRLFVTQSIPNDEDWPVLKCYVFLFSLKAVFLQTCLVSRPEFNGTELLIKFF